MGCPEKKKDEKPRRRQEPPQHYFAANLAGLEMNWAFSSSLQKA